MIPAQPGTVAVFKCAAYRSGVTYRNVVAWNDDGEPMVVGPGLLEAATTLSNFVRVDEPTEPAFGHSGVAPVQVIPGGGWMLTHRPFDDEPDVTVTERVIAWALCVDGSVRPMINDGGGMAEVRSEFDHERPFTVSHPDEAGAA